ncbi:hypothetical protein VCRA2121O127_170018 [Vibrio crassostreae]|uniref:Uncharacterized protein n=1 Tax=Vibrio crassostreae TaxID=246167 RepID=A0A822MNZ5_9VIBR|nr:hypothetical protein VCRA2119O124_220008 [Vibrio crassostreae]CAK2840993.1 hypothetical protein VCRA215O110_240008 [Vibrio crassostreae]CAK3255294.1 hypothetical protein VCRA2121O127_170018 [Vibrio crassostreae]CDT01177.1 hypothetical protein VCR5J5_1360134 [Vibrio crassostreae]
MVLTVLLGLASLTIYQTHMNQVNISTLSTKIDSLEKTVTDEAKNNEQRTVQKRNSRAYQQISE